MSTTPETDRVAAHGQGNFFRMTAHARRLEQERNKYKALWESLIEQYNNQKPRTTSLSNDARFW